MHETVKHKNTQLYVMTHNSMSWHWQLLSYVKDNSRVAQKNS